jgi:translation initiation factor 2B subunit (eIF-2B alpha/beta/delta family)
MLAPILADRSRGASEIEDRLLTALPELLTAHCEASRGSEAFLEELTRAIRRHQPSMANLLDLINRSWLVWEESAAEGGGAEGEAATRRRLEELWRSRRIRREGSRRRLGERLVELLRRSADSPSPSPPPTSWTFLTLSKSGTVLAGLGALAEAGFSATVVVGEGRPGLEGFELTAELRRRGIDAWAATDAAVAALAAGGAPPRLPVPLPPRRTAVLLGADAVGGESFLNKVGSRPLAAAARGAGLPCWVLTETSKLVPLGLFEYLVPPAAPAAELGAPASVPALSFLFEPVPLELASRLVSEEGDCDSRQIRRRISRLPVSARLRREVGAETAAGTREP